MAIPPIVNDICNVYDGIMLSEDEWASGVKRLLRAEMARHGVTYDELTERLVKLGVHDTSANIRNKVARGKFTAVFLLQCLRALGTDVLRIDDLARDQKQ